MISANPICVLHHHIGPESAFERGLGVSTRRDIYDSQIEWMAGRYNFISLDALISGNLPPRPLLLTFDDAFRSVLDVAKDVLAPHGIPSVFFVNPGLLEKPDAISLDSALAKSVSRVGLDAVCDVLSVTSSPDLGSFIRQRMSTFGAAERAEMRDRLISTFGPFDFSERAQLLSAADIPRLMEYGVELGNHTMSHVHCRSLRGDELGTEIVAAQHRLEALARSPVRSFSVPYGHEQDLTPRLLDILRQSGHKAIFLVHSRSNRWRSAPDIWYRTSLRDEAPGSLWKVLRFLPALRSLKNLVTR